MNILGLSGSPRKAGNTGWVISKMLEGAVEKGANTTLRHFGELNMKPCSGCFACKKDGSSGCVLKDDMQMIYEDYKKADIIILGSPVYMGQMTAQAKIFVDRMFACLSPRFSPHFKESGSPKKKLVLLFTQGNPDTEKFQQYFDYTKSMFGILELDVVGLYVVEGMRPQSAHEKEGLAESMRDIGISLV